VNDLVDSSVEEPPLAAPPDPVEKPKAGAAAINTGEVSIL
jgi:hypothetical protein